MPEPTITFVNENPNYFATIYRQSGNNQEEMGTVAANSKKSFETTLGEQWIVYAEDSEMIIGEVTITQNDQHHHIVFPGGRGDLGQSGGTGGN